MWFGSLPTRYKTKSTRAKFEVRGWWTKLTINLVKGGSWTEKRFDHQPPCKTLDHQPKNGNYGGEIVQAIIELEKLGYHFTVDNDKLKFRIEGCRPDGADRWLDEVRGQKEQAIEFVRQRSEWSETVAESLLKEYIDAIGQNPPELSTWVSQRGIMPVDDPIDEAFSRKNMNELRSAIKSLTSEWVRLAEWKELSQIAVDQIMSGQLTAPCRLPVSKGWHDIVGREVVVHLTQDQCESGWSRAKPGECHFTQGEAKEMFDSIGRGDDVRSWLAAKTMFKGVTV